MASRLAGDRGLAYGTLPAGLDFDAARGHRAVRLSFAAGPDRVEEALTRILRFQSRP